MNTTTSILTTVLDRWKVGVDAHDPEAVAAVFTEDAIFQGLHPYSIGPAGVAAYYASQPLGMKADYDLLETRQLADDLVLGYLKVAFSFVDRPTVEVFLSIVARGNDAENWRIGHYQVSKLAG
ncbi:nuclear transport factor 2 family protein [Kribbella sp. NBC_01245]|uniref:hypothetical protein n=1 Tax=Kribbella sp. NBC_01245 TaxID=2903578 RepID=UPI002E27CC8C|nr:hypothetical protein [Kribbella sp. NBC_01245]